MSTFLFRLTFSGRKLESESSPWQTVDRSKCAIFPRKGSNLWWPRGAFPPAENTSERRRAAVGVIRRSAVGQPSEKYVGAPSGRHRAAVGAPSDRRRSEDPRRLGNEGINSLVPRPSYGGREGHSRRRKIRRAAVGPPSERRRAAVGPPGREGHSRRRKIRRSAV